VRRIFRLPNVQPYTLIRVDTDPDTATPADIRTTEQLLPIRGALVRADRSGDLPDVYGPDGATRLYLKTVTDAGIVQPGQTGVDGTSGGSGPATLETAAGRGLGYADGKLSVALSTDAGNNAKWGVDNKLYVPTPPAAPVPAGFTATGAETLPRWAVTATNISSPSGQMYFSYFTSPTSFTATALQVRTGGTAAAATATVARIGLWAEEANGDLTLVGSTANTTATLFRAAQTNYRVTMTAPVEMRSGARYAIAPFQVTTVTAATFAGVNPSAGTMDERPRLSGYYAGAALTDLPQSVPRTSIGVATQMVYGAAMP